MPDGYMPWNESADAEQMERWIYEKYDKITRICSLTYSQAATIIYTKKERA